MPNNEKNPFLNSEFYGIIQGQEVFKYTLQNETVRVDITNLGGAITGIYLKGRDQLEKNIVAGFNDIKDYEDNPYYFGCVIGRYTNRIANGKFVLNGKNVQLSVNDGINHLHGGFKGFNKKVWKSSGAQTDNEVGVELEYVSLDGEEGYPGNLFVKIKYTLNSKNELSIEYNADTDEATPISLTNHSYFNLSGFETPTIYEHLLYVNAENYTEKNLNNTPTGNIIPVADTPPLDFRLPKKIGKEIHQFPRDKGFDYNFVLNKNVSREIVPAAQLKDPSSGRTVTVYTNQPGIQVYTANFWDGTVEGSHGSYQQHGAVALETQAFPDSPNHPSFPDTILQSGQHYFSTTIYEFGIE